MKRLYIAFFLGLAMMVTGCDKDSDSDNSGDVAVTGINVSPSPLTLAVGEAQPLTVEVLPADASDKSYTWSMDKEGVVLVENNIVTALSAGEVILTATTTDGGYTASCLVTVAADYDVTLNASIVSATYYGQEFSNGSEENYYMVFSDLGFDSQGYAIENGHYYIVDLFSDVAPSDLNNITIPEGTYTLGAYAETAAGTFTSDYSQYYDYTASGYNAYFTEGTVTISYSGSNLVVDANFVDELGNSHHLTYNGPCVVSDATSSGGDYEDITFVADDCYADYYGDQFSVGGEQNYYVILSDLGFDAEGYAYEGGHYYILDIFSDVAPTDLSNIVIPEGTYTLGESGLTEAGTFTSDYSSYQDYVEMMEYPFAAGEVVVTHEGSNTKFECVIVDVVGRTHTVTYNGPCNVGDASQMSVPFGTDSKVIKQVKSKSMKKMMTARR
ncbi:Ig-like domain-containing protein [uncultured Alistipes sp.]|uniref:Ig-like domain-containing protein n=1 Tax=uncultured Alistipes sp. TaxID=538949 RepID=UPI002601761A|nr:Ig-like domain-containing protein [uncultured Alistipes sp.]